MIERHDIKMTDFLALPQDELVRGMEIFEKLEDYICNYENMVALYGKDDIDATETLFRGMRNAFLLGKWYAEEVAAQQKSAEEYDW